MAIGDKPTDLPVWADDPGAEITEPSAGKKSQGWVKEKPPFAFFNWFFNAVYQWIGWTKEYGETHTHDGLGGDHSAPKVSLEAHVSVGSFGELVIAQDDELGGHEIEHNNTGSGIAARFTTDFLKANLFTIGRVDGDAAQMEVSTTLAGAREVTIEGDSSEPVALNAAAIRPTLSDSPGGDMGTLAPRGSSLYLQNLTKSVGKHSFTESLGVVSNSEISAFNTTGIWTTTGAPADTYVLDIDDASEVDGVVTVGASVAPLSGDTNQYLADINWDVINDRLIMRLYYFSTTTNQWENVLAIGPPSGMSMHVNFALY